ncbi:MAG TPA: C10 family peptidase [Bacteroidales bacterium]|nr:C10 family peptidase [Bacteroidales bacterium]
MKRIFTLFIAIVIASQSFADRVDEKEAKQIAENFFQAYAPDTKSGSVINKIIIEKYQNTESFYIYGFEGGGFVIVSADDDATPILGYSFTSKITDEIGSNTRFLFERYKLEIEDARQVKTKNSSIKQEWENLKNIKTKGEIKAAGPLLTTTWNQNPIYNMYCPGGSPTGCVATAMSQIMNYHEWPATGNGWHKYTPSDHPEYGVQYADFSSGNYDWANMATSISSGSTTAQKEAVAKLCYHAGVSVDMNYDPDGSGANSNDVMYALTSYFKYNPSTIEIVKYNSADETPYLNKIKNEIDNNRPIYYDGYGDDGGHAWVSDGYDNNNKVHINWGWGGSYNGYFLLSNMVAGSYDFTEGNSMILGIKPGNAYQDMLWTKQASAFSAQSRGIRYIAAVDERVAWAVAYDGSGSSAAVKDFTRTIDGSTWISGTINASGTDDYETSMITAVDENTAWVALFGPSGGGKIVKTSDGGETWEHQSTAAFSSPNGFPNVIHFWDANNGWCQGDPNGGYFEMYTTNNGGTTWTRVSQANIPANLSGEYGTIGYYCVYGDIVWFATNKGRIYKSADKGLNWDVYQTPLTNASFELSFKNANTGIIQRRGDGDNKVQYITTDGGANWTALNPTGNFYTSGFKFVPGSELLVSVGVDFNTPFMGISYSTDNGTTFTDYAEFYKNYQFTAIGAASSDAMWAGGFNSDQYSDGMWHYGYILDSLDFKFNKREVCINDSSVIFENASLDTYDSYQWEFGDGASPSAGTGIGPHTVKYTTEGSKHVKLIVTNGLEKDSLFKNDLIYIATGVSDPGVISGNTDVYLGETNTYSVLEQPNVSFIWDLPLDWTGNSITNSIDITFGGNPAVDSIKVTAKNACGEGGSNYLKITVNTMVGIEDFEETNKSMITIYPVPASNFIKIDGLIDKGTILIYNSIGVLIQRINNYTSGQDISVNNLKTGIYYIQIISGNSSVTKGVQIIR